MDTSLNYLTDKVNELSEQLVKFNEMAGERSGLGIETIILATQQDISNHLENRRNFFFCLTLLLLRYYLPHL